MAAINNIYTDEIYEKVNKESKLVVDDYKLELKSKSKSLGTIKQYMADIKMFLCWSVDNLDNKYILDMKKRDFRNFFLFMSETGKSSARINRVQCSLRNLLEFCYQDDDEYEDYNRNIMTSIKGVQKVEVREIVFLDDDQIDFLLDHLIEKEQYQKALYLSLSYDSAARRNEIAQVEKTNFLDSKMTNKVQGKRGKQFSLYYLDRTKEIAKMYFDQRGEDDIDSLWVTGYGQDRRELEGSALYQWAVSFRKILQQEYDEEILLNSHSLRHSSLENYENGSHHSLRYLGVNGLDIKELKVLANHEDTSTTEKYLKNKDDEKLKTLFGV